MGKSIGVFKRVLNLFLCAVSIPDFPRRDKASAAIGPNEVAESDHSAYILAVSGQGELRTGKGGG
ncbi:MAG: hypothetical protein V3T02_10035 [Alphaproteobacteria bacterium]